ncbi:phosphatase [Altererythrobacter sp. TH136]|nr:phosphatase [Altererythrobacter sp. TH136]
MERDENRSTAGLGVGLPFIEVGPSRGRIALGACPGKVASLVEDLDRVAHWGAAAVVTLLGDDELNALRVPQLGAAVRERSLAWYHLPVRDMSAPSRTFEEGWRQHGAAIRSLLLSGSAVFLHCNLGLGRAGTLAARLLVELGWQPAEAIQAVRKVRPGAIQSRAQERHVLGVQHRR